MAEPSTGELLERVQRLEDCQGATGLLHTFAAALDEPVLDDVVSLFLPDAVLQTVRGEHVGHAAIKAFFADAWQRDASAKRHFVMAPRVTWLRPGRVRVETYFTFIGRLPQESILGWGTYDDEIDTTGPEPRFARLRMESHLRTELAQGWAQQKDEK